jgi:lipid II:glycine glycyltransferase (peptidoglycan interpeptide bridge formation enzyme)
MGRKNAVKRWRFSESYFLTLAQALDDRARFVFISDGQEVRAAALFLFGPACAYYYLSATSMPRARGAATLALVEGFEAARQAGCAWMHLGGGLHDNDSLFKFKMRFGDASMDSWSYRRVVDAVAYQRMIAASGAPDEAQFFPAYRWKETH